MKNYILIICILALLGISSCGKNSSSPNPSGSGGSWSFKSTSYNTVTCVGLDTVSGAPAEVWASNATASNTSTYSSLIVTFKGQTKLPTVSGTYSVAGLNNQNGNPPNVVTISLTVGGSAGSGYITTAGNGAETVAVTVSNGKVSISGSGIMMANAYNGAGFSDSSTVSFNITQLQ